MSDYFDAISSKIGLASAVQLRKDWFQATNEMQKLSSKEWQDFIKKYPALRYLLSAKIQIKDVTGAFDVNKDL